MTGHTPTLPLIEHFINGHTRSPQSPRKQAVYHPASGQVSKEVVLGDASEVNAAVLAAQQAQVAWAELPPIRRARVMFRFLELLNAHKDEIAHMITAEHGKVFTDAQGEVSRGIDIV